MALEMLAVRWNDLKGLYEAPSAILEEALAKPATSFPIAK
jgi:hypothetical protein